MPPSALPALSVLVVDDLDDAADSLADVLELHGFTARAVVNSTAALLAVASDPPDAVVFDLLMPGLDGWELARRLRTCSTSKQMLLIALTGYPLDAARSRAGDVGIDLFVQKPVEPSVLVGALNRSGVSQ